jgi:hypothetical protein
MASESWKAYSKTHTGRLLLHVRMWVKTDKPEQLYKGMLDRRDLHPLHQLIL